MREMVGGFRGAIIVPAHNEGAVIERTLRPLSELAYQGVVDLVVAANGCEDDTVSRATSVAGVRVLDLPEPGKAKALNAADSVVEVFPRLYLDADVSITPTAVIDVLDHLAAGATIAARPPFVYLTDDASWSVRAYFRARERISVMHEHLWGAGVYALNREGHARLGSFPELVSDDLWVDSLFDDTEKAVVDTEPVVVRCPRDGRSLLAVLRRVYRGNREQEHGSADAPTGLFRLLQTVKGPSSLVDAGVYLYYAIRGRRHARKSEISWERDDSSRVGGENRGIGGE